MVLIGSILTVPPVVSQSRRAPRETVERPQPKAQPTPPPTREQRPEPSPQASPESSRENQAPEDQQEVETVKTDTNLVTVPVIAMTRDGNYVPDLRQEEFNIWEAGEKQQPAFFATVSAPFHVVLLLDTSGSTKEKLGQIRQAAIAFVEQLQSGDRVKVISFDDQVRELSDFTNDRAALRSAIEKTTSGQGTKLYDAFELALSSIKTIKGRKAIVLFTDGVDYHSDASTFDSTLNRLDEEGVIVYPIRYETRAETERLLREAVDDPTLPTSDVIHRAPPGTTAPTFPSDDPSTVPTSGQRPDTGPLGLPTAAEIMRRRRERDRERDRYPDRLPPSTDPSDPGARDPLPRGGSSDPGDPRDPTDPRNSRDRTNPAGRSRRPEDESTKVMIDQLYLTADSFLGELANKSGGRLLRADTLGSLPDAFGKIAAELRTQYTIGYYPTNKARDGQYRKIKVTSTRKGVVVRARPGYRAPSDGS
jgi:Mg-chelatase subunit ChlD